MFKLLIKHKILDYCINNFFDKVIQNFNVKNPDKNMFSVHELTVEHTGSEIAHIIFTFNNELVTLSAHSYDIDKIYLFQAWVPRKPSENCWQIHVRHVDGNQFHYLIDDNALLYLE